MSKQDFGPFSFEPRQRMPAVYKQTGRCYSPTQGKTESRYGEKYLAWDDDRYPLHFNRDFT
jgi:hypothetical protein